MHAPRTKEKATRTAKLGARRDVRLPEETVCALGLRTDAKLDIHIPGGVVVLVPADKILKDQRYFWTPEWQAKEAEADLAIARGELLGPFNDAEAAIHALRTAKV